MTATPAQVTFHGVDHSDALEVDIRERVSWLQQFYGGIIGCRVVVEIPHRHPRDGRHFRVRVEVDVVGGGSIIATHEPTLHGRLKDVEQTEHRKDTEIEATRRYAHVAVHAAFDVARRRLRDFARETSTVRLLGTHHYVSH